MKLKLAFHPAVRPEVREAYRWYERQRAGLGAEFIAAIERVYDRIRKTPKLHAIVCDDIRRALPRKFPYGVYYRLHEDHIEILAVHHSSRDPAGWKSRM